jgi:hypothetical protein
MDCARIQTADDAYLTVRATRSHRVVAVNIVGRHIRFKKDELRSSKGDRDGGEVTKDGLGGYTARGRCLYGTRSRGIASRYKYWHWLSRLDLHIPHPIVTYKYNARDSLPCGYLCRCPACFIPCEYIFDSTLVTKLVPFAQ